MSELERIGSAPGGETAANIVFVHGLGGDKRATWQHEATQEKRSLSSRLMFWRSHHKLSRDATAKAFWPDWLATDFPKFSVWSFGYDASPSNWTGSAMPLQDRATNLLQTLLVHGLHHKPIVFVCHSLGGLVVKQALNSAATLKQKNWELIAKSTKGIVFLSTPHVGADLADYMAALGTILRASSAIEDLRHGGPHLRTLNQWFLGYVTDVKTSVSVDVYFEKRDTFGVRVVSETSGNPWLPGVVPIAMDCDHLDICKLATPGHLIYLSVVLFLKNLNLSGPKGVSLDPATSNDVASEVPFAVPLAPEHLSADPVARLAQLPIDRIPEPGPLPAPHVMPLARNDDFVGRSEHLKAMAQQVKAGGVSAVTAATGKPGVGKSQLACEFAYRYGRYFAGGVFWLSFADANAVPFEIARCGGPGRMGLWDAKRDQDTDYDAKAKDVVAAWEQDVPRLLVFDNCENPALLRTWRSKGGGARIIVTSRRRDWSGAAGVEPVEIDVLPRGDSMKLLRRHLGHDPDGPSEDDAACDKIAEMAGDLPIALHVAGRLLERYRGRRSAADLLSGLQGADDLLDLTPKDAQPTPTDREARPGAFFTYAWDDLNPKASIEDRHAVTLATIAAALAPGEIVPDWLLDALFRKAASPQPTGQHREDAVARLQDIGFLDVLATERSRDGLVTGLTSSGVRMHRLIAKFVARRADASELVAIGRVFCGIIGGYLDLGRIALVAEVDSHLRHVERGEDRYAAYRCGRYLGDLAMVLGRSSESRALYEKGLRIAEELVRSEPDRADYKRDLSVSCSKLADLARAEGRGGEAKGLYEKGLRIAEELLRSELDRADYKRDLSVSYNKLADLARAEGRGGEAKGLYEKGLRIAEELVRSEPDRADYKRDLSVSYNKLADLARAEGRGGEAKGLYEKGLRIAEGLVRSEPDRADYKRDLSVSYERLADLARAEGRGGEAKGLYEKGLTIREELVRSEPDRADYKRDLSVSCSKLADLARAEGRGGEAKVLYEKGLRIAEELVQSEPDRADYKRDLSVSYERLADLARAEGRGGEAKGLYEKGLRIAEELVRSEPDRADYKRDLSVSYNKLADLARAEGRGGEAKGLHEKGLTIREELVRSEPDRADYKRDLSVSYERLADLARAEGRGGEAKGLYEKGLTIREELVRSELDRADYKRDLSVSYNKLADLARAEGRGGEAKGLYEKDLRIAEELLRSEPNRADYRVDVAISHKALFEMTPGLSAEAHHLMSIVTVLEPLRASGLSYGGSDDLWTFAQQELAKRQTAL